MFVRRLFTVTTEYCNRRLIAIDIIYNIVLNMLMVIACMNTVVYWWRYSVSAINVNLHLAMIILMLITRFLREFLIVRHAICNRPGASFQTLRREFIWNKLIYFILFYSIYVTLTVHLSITLVKTNLTYNIFVLYYIYYVYYIPLHVSSSNMLIIRRLNCINTASGTVSLCRWPFGAQVARVLSQLVHMSLVSSAVRRTKWRCCMTCFVTVGILFSALSQNCAKRLLVLSCPSVRMQQLGSHWTDFQDIWHLWIFRKSAKKIQVSLKSDKNKGTSHEDQYIFLIISRSFLLGMGNVSGKRCGENPKTHFMFIFLKIMPCLR
jgi:hypothetical protein